MASGRTCGYQGCRNPVKEGDSRCWQHVGKFETVDGNDHIIIDVYDIEQRQKAFRNFRRNRRLRNALLHPPDTLGKAGEIYNRDHAYETLDITPETVSGVYKAAEVLGPLESRKDIIRSIENGGIEKFNVALSEELGSDRVDFMELQGLNFNGTRRNIAFHDYSYATSIVDYDTTSEAVVDPFARMLIPEKLQQNKAQETIIGLGSPFQDQIFIGTLREYVEGDLLWDSVRIGKTLS